MIKTAFQIKKPFVGFVTGGDGDIDYCVDCCLQMIAGGVDILEIGLPFSDPVADGPVIQKSSQRALQAGTTTDTLLEIARRIRAQSSVPLILFSYFNPLLQKGGAFLREAKSAGFDAILIVDLPSLIDHTYFQEIKSADMTPIFLASPSTSTERLEKIANVSTGFIYYACQKGTTGVKTSLPADFSYHINRLRQATQLPIVVGFGIADKISAHAVLDNADGFVVGSAFVKLMENKANPIELKNLAEQIDPR